MEKRQKQPPTTALSLQGFLRSPSNKLPILREAVDMIFYATQGGPFNIRQLAITVEQDKMLQKEILSICASDYYSGRNPIRQISQAIRRLGPVGFRGVAMQAFLNIDVYYNPKWEKATHSLKHYSIAIAHACRITSHRASQQGDLAFLLGILHRIGLSLPLLLLSDPNENMTQAVETCETLHATHPSISQFILQKWGMPEELIETIGCYGQLIINEAPNTLSAILIVAEELVQRLGRKEPQLLPTKEKFRPPPRDNFQDACRILNITEADIPQLLVNTQETLRSSA
jgi:HD-like signal output (HDOD) protein